MIFIMTITCKYMLIHLINPELSGLCAAAEKSMSDLLSCIAAKVMQERTRRPSTCTVHARHSPRSHAFLDAASSTTTRSNQS